MKNCDLCRKLGAQSQGCASAAIGPATSTNLPSSHSLLDKVSPHVICPFSERHYCLCLRGMSNVTALCVLWQTRGVIFRISAFRRALCEFSPNCPKFHTLNEHFLSLFFFFSPNPSPKVHMTPLRLRMTVMRSLYSPPISKITPRGEDDWGRGMPVPLSRTGGRVVSDQLAGCTLFIFIV